MAETSENSWRRLLVYKEEMRQIVAEVSAEIGFVPNPDATPESKNTFSPINLDIKRFANNVDFVPHKEYYAQHSAKCERGREYAPASKRRKSRASLPSRLHNQW